MIISQCIHRPVRGILAADSLVWGNQHKPMTEEKLEDELMEYIIMEPAVGWINLQNFPMCMVSSRKHTEHYENWSTSICILVFVLVK